MGRSTQYVAHLGCSFSVGVFSAFNNFTLTLWLASFTTSYLVLGLLAALLLSTTVLALPMGRLGNRYGKRRTISAGYAIMTGAALAGLAITTKEQGALVFPLAGVGNAAILVLKIPLLADLVPHRHMGVAAGILAASGSLAAPLASIVAGALSDLYGPRAIFGLMAVMVCLALALMPGVQTKGQLHRDE